MPKTKEISLDLRKRIVDALKAGAGYTKFSQNFQVSRTGEKYHQFKDSHTVPNKPGRGSEGCV